MMKQQGHNGPPPPPQRPHWPITLTITNLSALDNRVYLERLKDPDFVSPFGGESNYEVYSGQSLEVTATLPENEPVDADEPPFVVDMEYVAVHEDIRKTPGIFLFKTTNSVVFRGDSPNNGSRIQTFPVQTIRFDLETEQGGDAEIVVRASYKGHHHAEVKFILHP